MLRRRGVTLRHHAKGRSGRIGRTNRIVLVLEVLG